MEKDDFIIYLYTFTYTYNTKYNIPRYFEINLGY